MQPYLTSTETGNNFYCNCFFFLLKFKELIKKSNGYLVKIKSCATAIFSKYNLDHIIAFH